MIEFLKKSFKYIVGIVVLIAAFLIGSSAWTRHNTPEVVTPPSISEKDLQPYFPMETKATVKDISKQITKAKETRKPDYHYYAPTQKQADEIAQQYAKKTKADKIVKETKEVEVKDENGKTTSTVTENNYYGINLERKHKIKAGAAVVDGTPYMSIGYQNRDVEYKAYYSPEKHKGGVGVEVTIAKW